jgi:biotin operon repressor
MGSKRVHIPEEVLRRLYCDEKLSQEKIAERLGCSVTAVSSKMKLYGLALRSKSEEIAIRDGIFISGDELRRLYFEEKLTQEQIGERLGCSQRAIQRHMKKHGIISRNNAEANFLRFNSFRQDFDGDLPLKAYMLGFCKGDVHPWVRDTKSQTIRLMTATTKPEQIELFQNLFSPYGHMYISKPDSRGATHMAAHLNFSFSFLLDREDSIPGWVLTDEEAFFGFLAG